MAEKILTARGLKKYFKAKAGMFAEAHKEIHAVDGVDIEVEYGKTLGIVGETGCGKTTLAKLLVGLHRPDEGSVYYRDWNIFYVKKKRLKTIRKNIQMVFQNPFSSLNPKMTVRDTLAEGLLIHNIVKRNKMHKRLSSLMHMVGLGDKALGKYPHEFSGGERQRIALARALSTEPKLIICDEPVSSLDVSIQAKILNLLLELQEKLNLSYIFISHDISVVQAISDRIAVMLQGKIIEEGPALKICKTPEQSYTKELMRAARLGLGDVLQGDTLQHKK